MYADLDAPSALDAAASAPFVPLYVFTRGFGLTGGLPKAIEAPRKAALRSGEIPSVPGRMPRVLSVVIGPR